MQTKASRYQHDYLRAMGLAVLATAAAAGCASADATEGPGHTSPVLSPPGPVDAGIPTPESVIGHTVGQRAARYDTMVRYLHALADASPRVTLTAYARSHEGRTLYYLTITSEHNHARLDAIRADNARLADPRTVSADEAQRIADNLPGIAWLAYAIHGDELSSTDAAMQVAYQLAAGQDAHTRQLREQLVIHIDPLMNPDGRERYLGQIEQLTGTVPNTDYQSMQHSGLWSAGRGNHYLFDMNRDWLMQVHPETRGRAAAILSWNPHLLVDSHEMEALETYLFDPPREPFNLALSEKNLEWRRRFSADHAAAFDRHGWSYYTKEWYEEWYPGYSNAWASLLGAVGLLYEQAGVNSAAVKQPAGHELTYPEAVEHQYVSTMANLATLLANRKQIVADFLADRQWAVSDTGPFAETYLLPPPADRARFDRFTDLLTRQGIETSLAAEAFEAGEVVDVWGQHTDRKQFPAGTLIVRSAQPHRRLLHAALAFDPHLSPKSLLEERKELENRRDTQVYDVTAWNLSMAYGLEACWATSVPDVPTTASEPRQRPPALPTDTAPKYGYLIDGADADVYAALVRLLERECKPRVAAKPFTIHGRAYRPGAVLLRRHENPDALTDILAQVTTELTVDVRPADTALCDDGPDLGGNRFHLLQPPRVAIASQWPLESTSFGSTWYLLDQRLGLRASPINVQRLSRMDLRKYNVLILPHAWEPDRLSAVLDAGALSNIKAWVEAGGTLIAMGGSAAFLADKDRGLSAVRRRQDVLNELPAYEEARQQERNARKIDVDPAIVWGHQTPPTTQPAPEQEQVASEQDRAATVRERKPDDIDALKRQDEWLRIFSPLGAMALADLDPEHWLCFGLGERLPVLLDGPAAYLSRHPVSTPARLADQADLRLSGLIWPEARQRWAGTAYATVERLGAGQVILFATDPFFRAYYEGSGRLLLNAVVLGPGLGTKPPMPW